MNMPVRAEGTRAAAINRMRVVRAIAAIAGVAIVLLLFATLNAPTVAPVQLYGYHLGDTDHQIVVMAGRGRCDKMRDTRVQEDISSVRVTVLVERARGTCTADIVFEEIAVTLANPLAGRTVIDSDGQAVPVRKP